MDTYTFYFSAEKTQSGVVENFSDRKAVTHFSENGEYTQQSYAVKEAELVMEKSHGAVGIITRDSDDESISVSLPSNGEESTKVKQLNSFLNTSIEENNVEKNNLVRSNLKRQILRILSTDDEEDEIAELPFISNNEELKLIDQEKT